MARQLVVVDSGRQPLQYIQDSRVLVVQCSTGPSLGELRNLACACSTAPLFMQWDDDDWHGPSRISHQVRPILEGAADVSVIEHVLVFDVLRMRLWRREGSIFHTSSATRSLHAGTLCFSRDAWEAAGGYLGDAGAHADAELLNRFEQRGFAIARLPNAATFAYVRHGANTLQLSRVTGSRGVWNKVSPADILPLGDRLFYSAQAAVGRTEPVSCANSGERQ